LRDEREDKPRKGDVEMVIDQYLSRQDTFFLSLSLPLKTDVEMVIDQCIEKPKKRGVSIVD
jgi:hypothetical protein